MTNQEIIDAVLLGIRGQGGPAAAADTYLYRSPDGLRCPVGWLIPDEEYGPELEGRFVEHISTEGRPVLSALLTRSSRLLGLMQVIHDEVARKSLSEGTEFLPAWEVRMQRLATEFGLTYKPPTA